jgi:hypothetical protein
LDVSFSTTWQSKLKKIVDDGFDGLLSLNKAAKDRFIQRAKWEWRTDYGTLDDSAEVDDILASSLSKRCL